MATLRVGIATAPHSVILQPIVVAKLLKMSDSFCSFVSIVMSNCCSVIAVGTPTGADK